MPEQAAQGIGRATKWEKCGRKRKELAGRGELVDYFGKQFASQVRAAKPPKTARWHKQKESDGRACYMSRDTFENQNSTNVES